MLRFLAKVVLLLAALFFAMLMMVAGLGMVGPIIVPFLPADAHYVMYTAIPRLSMIVGPIVLLCFLLCLVLVAWRVLAHEGTGKHRQAEAGESRMMQEVYQGLSHLEERVEALETILIERAGSAIGKPAGRLD